MNNRSAPIIVEQIFDNTITEVWDAITQLAQMKKWFFSNLPAFEPKVGFQTDFVVQSVNLSFHHLWEIIDVVPTKKIKYRWRYKEYDGEAFVTMELFEKNKQTLLKLTNEGLENFPEDIPEFKRESCQGGWEYFIQQNLKAYLSSNPHKTE